MGEVTARNSRVRSQPRW